MYILLLTLFGSSLYTFPLTRFKIFCHYSLCCISGIAGLIYHYILFFMLLNFILFLFIYLFLLYNVVLVLPYFNMNLPWVLYPVLQTMTTVLTSSYKSYSLLNFFSVSCRLDVAFSHWYVLVSSTFCLFSHLMGTCHKLTL